MRETIITLILMPACLLAGSMPNILMIYTDDHGYADLGAQGVFSDLKTPNIDALVAGGVRMTDGYSSAPQCVPSRAGLMSGQFQNRLGVESNNQFKEPGGFDGFNAADTIAERLKRAGYATGMAGKWHLGPGKEIPNHGFDHFYYRNSARPAIANMDLRGRDVPFGEYKSDVYHLEACADVAAAFIERYHSKPFFFYLAFRAPHVPLDPPQKYLDRFPGEMPERRRKALAMLSAVDDGVGLIMETLRKNHIEENTLIFIIGDNGAPLKIHKLDAPGGGPGWDGSLNDPMNGEKGMLTEGGIRVPYAVYWKGTIPGGQVYSNPVITLDVAATANALAGQPDAPELDGVNLIPYLTGEKSGAPHDALCWRWMGQAAIRKGKWKYLAAGDREYLFDMEADFEETSNLLAEMPELAKQLHQELDQWSRTLQPPGLDADSPSSIANEYFNWYLDGKRNMPTPEVDRKAGKKESVAKKKGPSDDYIFQQRDRNKDGMVTWEEYLGGRTEKVDSIRNAFDRRDRNKDGVWLKDEID